jgi:Zn-dependent metalloprotease
MNNLCSEELSRYYRLGAMAICLFAVVFFYGCGERATVKTNTESKNDEPYEDAQHENAPNKSNQEGAGEGEGGVVTSEAETDEEKHSEGGVFRFDEIDTQRRETSIPIVEENEVSSKTKEVLMRDGGLGDQDELTPMSTSTSLGSSQVIKLQQTYQGIPIYGAETLVTINNKHIEKIYSKTVSNIEIDTRPSLSIDQAVEHAEKIIEAELISQDNAVLIIVSVDGDYKLAWMGLFAIAGDVRTFIFDANDGSILSQRTALMDVTSHDGSENQEKDISDATE